MWRGRLDLQVCFDGRAPAVFMTLCSFYHTWVRTAKGTAACCATDNDTNPRIRRTNAELKLGLDWQRHRARACRLAGSLRPPRPYPTRNDSSTAASSGSNNNIMIVIVPSRVSSQSCNASPFVDLTAIFTAVVAAALLALALY